MQCSSSEGKTRRLQQTQVRGAAGDDLREVRDPSSRDLLAMVKKVDFILNEMAAVESFVCLNVI